MGKKEKTSKLHQYGERERIKKREKGKKRKKEKEEDHKSMTGSTVNMIQSPCSFTEFSISYP